VPAAAVIPALQVYVIAIAVKKFVVYFFCVSIFFGEILLWENWRVHIKHNLAWNNKIQLDRKQVSYVASNDW